MSTKLSLAWLVTRSLEFNANPNTPMLYEDQFVPADDVVEAFKEFVAIVRQLRRDCPWDREQTHESVKHLMIEETFEAVEAIDEEDWGELKKELGDVFLHVLFHSTMAEQDDRFTLREVMQLETEKLIRRHPHVFGSVEVDGAEQVEKNWEQIKRKEGKRSTLQGVPRHMPALLRAYRMQEKAAGVGFDFPNAEDTWKKVEEELAEFKETMISDMHPDKKEDELGDLLFAIVNYARFFNLQPENALRLTNTKFERRFTYIEDRLKTLGKSWDDVDLEEMDRYWDEAKTKE